MGLAIPFVGLSAALAFSIVGEPVTRDNVLACRTGDLDLACPATGFTKPLAFTGSPDEVSGDVFD